MVDDGTRPLDVGVIGVGSMGAHHARVYDELRDANLVGVFDVDADRANRVATRHGTAPVPLETLLERADARRRYVDHSNQLRTPTRFSPPVINDCWPSHSASRNRDTSSCPTLRRRNRR
jgi:ornithine cyclodeaminase/alanine dehydrogenase-like protein (mu-crystallin family)